MISFDKVNVSFDGTPVLEDFDLEVARGEKVLVYGKSGAGKSTLLKLLLGFVRPDAGTIYFGGRELNRRSVWEVRRRVAYVGQDLDLGEGKVSEFVAGVFALRANAALRRDAGSLERAMEWLELSRKLLDKDLNDTSGGERQRLAIALALALERDVFLLDEVTSAVESDMKARIAEHFASLKGATVLAVSHDVNWLDQGGVRVVGLGSGNGC